MLNIAFSTAWGLSTCHSCRIPLKFWRRRPNKKEDDQAKPGDFWHGTTWFGSDGWLHVARGVFATSLKNASELAAKEDEIQLYVSRDQHRNFLDCAKSRKPTICPAEVGHRSATPGHLGTIAMKLGRKFKFDPKTEKIIGDKDATAMLSKDMRKPWTL